ncbi:hypothetical protein RFI_32904 [Reticulomyxa filosa]|uniref:Transmembrane protein n=1 Tax=Reticulomyxa filosa TaxID=46433 RepID=X6LRJ7_RETFI|nr:hypothetical protein RFI_32904 [Reticulomyxa filosa]|eukprot:ETO04493.1 hypothetical protein RFI_32904 [Reticulomyxa filosa]
MVGYFYFKECQKFLLDIFPTLLTKVQLEKVGCCRKHNNKVLFKKKNLKFKTKFPLHATQKDFHVVQCIYIKKNQLSLQHQKILKNNSFLLIRVRLRRHIGSAVSTIIIWRKKNKKQLLNISSRTISCPCLFVKKKTNFHYNIKKHFKQLFFAPQRIKKNKKTSQITFAILFLFSSLETQIICVTRTIIKKTKK